MADFLVFGQYVLFVFCSTRRVVHVGYVVVVHGGVCTCAHGARARDRHEVGLPLDVVSVDAFFFNELDPLGTSFC